MEKGGWVERMAGDRFGRGSWALGGWEEPAQEAQSPLAPRYCWTRCKKVFRSQSRKWKIPHFLGCEAEFAARVLVVRERMETKEKETTGFWLTEEKMKKSGDYSPYHDGMNDMWKQVTNTGFFSSQPFSHPFVNQGNPSGLSSHTALGFHRLWCGKSGLFNLTHKLYSWYHPPIPTWYLQMKYRWKMQIWHDFVP